MNHANRWFLSRYAPFVFAGGLLAFVSLFFRQSAWLIPLIASVLVATLLVGCVYWVIGAQIRAVEKERDFLMTIPRDGEDMEELLEGPAFTRLQDKIERLDRTREKTATWVMGGAVVVGLAWSLWVRSGMS